MKTQSIVASLIGLCITFISCKKEVMPSDNVTKEYKTFTGYHSLEVSDAFHVNVYFSPSEEKLEIEANENLHKYIIVRKVSDKLVIGIDDCIEVGNNAILNVTIVTANISEFYISGACRVVLQDTLKSNYAGLELSGASSFSGVVETINLYSVLSGASRLSLTGNTDSFNIEASGASDIRDYNFSVKDLNIELSGASQAKLTVNGAINLEISGASALYYKGNAVVIRQSVSGASTIKKLD
jgi:hypothetical protein